MICKTRGLCFKAELCDHQQMSGEQLQLCAKAPERILARLFLLSHLMTHPHCSTVARRFQLETYLELLWRRPQATDYCLKFLSPWHCNTRPWHVITSSSLHFSRDWRSGTSTSVASELFTEVRKLGPGLHLFVTLFSDFIARQDYTMVS